MLGENEDDIVVTPAQTYNEILEARRFQAQRYLQAGYIDSMPPTGVIEDEWVAHSTYHVARSLKGDLVGVCRFVNPSEKQLPIFRHFSVDSKWMGTLEQHASTSYEMGALAASPTYAKFAVAAALYRQTVRQFRVFPGHVHLLAALDARLFRAMRRMMRFPFVQIGEAQHFLGSETIPAYLYLPSALEQQVLRAPEAARFFSGFDNLSLLEDEVIDLREKYPELEPAADT